MTTIIDMISSNKTTNMFVKEENINLLWKIIINTPVFKTSININGNGNEVQQKLRSYYIQHLRTFVEENIYDTSTIIDFNKKFISYFIKKFQSPSNENINTTINQNTSNNTEIQKLRIDNNNLGKNVITIEELKNERLSEFENRYQKIQNDFDIYRKNEAPEDINFLDKNRDNPINSNEFQQQITNTNKDRKIQETNFSNNTNDHTQALKWLNLKEVPKSLIPEPTVFDKPPSAPSQNNQNNTNIEHKNKNDLITENSPAVTIKPKSVANEPSITHIYSLLVQLRHETIMLNQTVKTMKKKIEELETKLAKIDTTHKKEEEKS